MTNLPPRIERLNRPQPSRHIRAAIIAVALLAAFAMFAFAPAPGEPLDCDSANLPADMAINCYYALHDAPIGVNDEN